MKKQISTILCRFSSMVGQKKMSLLVLGVIALFTMSFSMFLLPDPPPDGNTGSPGDGADCSNCHGDFTVNSGTGTATITTDIPACGYTPLSTYSITVSIAQTGTNEFQFQCSPQNASGTYLGTMNANSSVQIYGVKYISGASGTLASTNSNSWTFTWTAPAAATGPVTFYASFAAVDGDASESGDYIYTKSLTVNEAGSYSASAVPTAANCYQSCDGSATVTAICGNAPYTYAWNTTPVQTTATATGLCSGSYSVLVIDATAATISATVSVSEPTALTASVTSTDQTVSSPADGTASANVSGGTAPYTYSWNSTPAQSTATATGLAGGNYTVSVTDSNGCSGSYTVTVNNTVGVAEVNAIKTISAFPNPTRGDLVFEAYINVAGEYTLSIFDVTGKQVSTESVLLNKGRNIKEISLSNQTKGVFFIVLKSDAGISKVIPVTKSE